MADTVLMPSIVHNAKATAIPAGLPESGLAGWRIVRPVLEQMLAAAKLNISTDSTLADPQKINGGVHLTFK